jgi:D-beta-D-heptose 7-phosphate kinase/D-beta-D-heptose 1-phosphate adenosyltransferase
VGQIERWREAGLRIGFTNGVFDILHPGHVRVLEESRSRCDRLIVGLNSDASVKRLKGPERPVNDATFRGQVLAGLSAVDAVVIFEEDTPLNLITALKPDVLVKGGDYSRDTIVGADLVEARGGEVIVVPLVPGQSTTSIIARSRAGA